MGEREMRAIPVAVFVLAGGLVILLSMALGGWPAIATAGTIPPDPSGLLNGDFECSAGYTDGVNDLGQTIRVPNGWNYVAQLGSPKVNSARIQYTGSCDGSGHVERIHGEDSFSLRSQDMETPPTPGKPFDSVLLQQVGVEPGGDYSLSGWMLTLCGGSAVPNDCPSDGYMAKMLGIDPAGGVDSTASSVVWVENRKNFISPDGERIGWQNLRIAATAEAMTMTVYARVNSPFQWHGNHGFIDALSLVRAPVASLRELPETSPSGQVELEWSATQSPDVVAIPDGNYQLLVDIERRVEDEDWRPLVTAFPGDGQLTFIAPCLDTTYEFRIRARRAT